MWLSDGAGRGLDDFEVWVVATLLGAIVSPEVRSFVFLVLFLQLFALFM